MENIESPIPAGNHGRDHGRFGSEGCCNERGTVRQNRRVHIKPDRLFYALRPKPDFGFTADYTDGRNLFKRPPFPYASGYPGITGQGKRQKQKQRKHNPSKDFSGRSCNNGRREFLFFPCVASDQDFACGRNRQIPGDGRK
jgi:hypothetical protein